MAARVVEAQLSLLEVALQRKVRGDAAWKESGVGQPVNGVDQSVSGVDW